jgi:hypothetical protein
MAGLPPFPWATTLRRTEELLGFCQKVAEFLRGVSKLQILDGQLLEVTFANVRGVRVRHTLGRPYTGAIVVMTNDTAVTPLVTAFDVREAGRQGLDVSRFIELGGGAVPFTATLTVWVF